MTIEPDTTRGPGPDEAQRVALIGIDDAMLESLRLLIDLNGHTTLLIDSADEEGAAGEGPRWLAVAGEFRPEVVFLGERCGRMQRTEIEAAIRAQPWGQGVRLIAL